MTATWHNWTVPWNWADYDLGYQDGKEDASQGKDASWGATARNTYTTDEEYWEGYGDGRYNATPKPHNPVRVKTMGAWREE